jgi:hypothetical protein
MPVLDMIPTKHPLPLGDDPRFIGFAVAIEDDGSWILCDKIRFSGYVNEVVRHLEFACNL